MDNTLTGKTAIVTGGTRGIGRAIAQKLLQAGARVAICGRSEDTVGRAVTELAAQTGGRIAGQAADVTDANQIRKFFEFVDDTFHSLDILVNNAGMGVFQKVAQLEAEDWQRTLDTNLTSVFHFCHLALGRFGQQGGFIVNISSLAGKNAFSGGAAYNASKFGLNGFSEALMLDHRYDNLRVCSIMPGSVATGFNRGEGAPADASAWKIQPEDIAEVVLTVLCLPARTMVSSVEIRPAKPQK